MLMEYIHERVRFTTLETCPSMGLQVYKSRARLSDPRLLQFIREVQVGLTPCLLAEDVSQTLVSRVSSPDRQGCRKPQMGVASASIPGVSAAGVSVTGVSVAGMKFHDRSS